MKRQKIRRFLLILAWLLFPIVIWYFSPYLIIMGALEGIINGSFLVFVSMLVGSIVFGRLFCGYLCPMAGLQECAFGVNEKAPKQGWKNYIKYFIWAIWLTIVIITFLSKGKIVRVDFFYQTDHGISISNIYGYIIYYIVAFLVLVPSVLFGKRVFCHYLCWVAPFMVIGTAIRRVLHLPGLHIKADTGKCISCKQCNKHCPMSLDVSSMVQKGSVDSYECIQCGECVDSCPKKVLKYSLKIEKRKTDGK